MEPEPSAVRVCRYSATVVLPVRSISWRVITWTGEGVSVFVRGMLDPVTVIRSRLVACSCANAEEDASAPTSNRVLLASTVEMDWARLLRLLLSRWTGCFTASLLTGKTNNDDGSALKMSDDGDNLGFRRVTKL